MAHPYHHAVSSSRKWGGTPEDFLAIHDWFDATKSLIADFRHRALRHHAEGIFLAEQIFGPTITITCSRCLGAERHCQACGDTGTKQIPVRWIGEQHVQEDIGYIPSAVDWLRAIQAEPWMNRSRKLSRELEGVAQVNDKPRGEHE